MENYKPCADIKSACHAIRRKFEALDVGGLTGFTPGQCRIIGFIMENGDRPVYQKDIEAEFNIRRSTATRLLQGMEHKNLIMRRPEENDGRLKRIRLTEKATERSREVLERISVIEKQLTEGITAEEMAALHSVCRRIRQNAEATEEIRGYDN